MTAEFGSLSATHAGSPFGLPAPSLGELLTLSELDAAGIPPSSWMASRGGLDLDRAPLDSCWSKALWCLLAPACMPTCKSRIAISACSTIDCWRHRHKTGKVLHACSRRQHMIRPGFPMPRQQTAKRWVVAAETATSQRLRHCCAAYPALSGVHAGIGRLQRPLARRPLWQQHRSHVDCQRSGRRRQAEAERVHQRRYSGWSSSVRERQVSIHTFHAHLGDVINGGRLGRYCSCSCSGVQDRGAVM